MIDEMQLTRCKFKFAVHQARGFEGGILVDYGAVDHIFS